MTCEATLQLLPLHIGGDLSLDEAVAVEAHLQNCASCASESQSFQTSFDAMQMQALLEPAVGGIWVDLEPRLDAADALASLESPWRHRLSAWLPAVAAMLAIAVGLNLLIPSMPQALHPTATIGQPVAAMEASPSAEIEPIVASPSGALVEVPDTELRRFLLENGAYLRDLPVQGNEAGAAVPVSVRRRRF